MSIERNSPPQEAAVNRAHHRWKENHRSKYTAVNRDSYQNCNTKEKQEYGQTTTLSHLHQATSALMIRL